MSTCDWTSMFSLIVISLYMALYHCHLFGRMKIQGHLEVQDVLVNLHLQLGLEGHQNQDHLEDLYMNSEEVPY